MRRLVAPILAATLAACARSPRPQARPEPTISDVVSGPSDADIAAARAAIEPVFARMLRAANAHDAEAHLAAYAKTPALTFVVGDEVITGWDSLLVRQRGWWQNGKSDVVYSLVDSARYQSPAPGVVVQTYVLAARRSAPDGSVREGRIVVTDVWQRRAEGWRIVYAHEAIVPPPPGR